MESKTDKALARFGPFDCAPAVLAAWCEDYGLDTATALKLTCGLAAGMSRLGHTCGAVSGAYLVIGLKYGKCHADDAATKEKTFALVQEFEKRFLARHGATNCRDLIELDLRHTDKTEAMVKIQKICPGVIRTTVEILEDIL